MSNVATKKEILFDIERYFTWTDGMVLITGIDTIEQAAALPYHELHRKWKVAHGTLTYIGGGTNAWGESEYVEYLRTEMKNPTPREFNAGCTWCARRIPRGSTYTQNTSTYQFYCGGCHGQASRVPGVLVQGKICEKCSYPTAGASQLCKCGLKNGGCAK